MSSGEKYSSLCEILSSLRNFGLMKGCKRSSGRRAQISPLNSCTRLAPDEDVGYEIARPVSFFNAPRASGEFINRSIWQHIEMATVTIRNLPEEVRQRLRKQAARAGRSMEAEIRLILTAASVAEDHQASFDGLREWVDRLYGGRKPSGVVDDLIAERRQQATPE